MSDKEWDVLALPCRLGGLGIINLVKSSMLQYECSKLITVSLVKLIISDSNSSQDTLDDVIQAKLDVKKKRRNQLDDDAARTQSELIATLKRSVDLAKEKWASSWLMALPLEDQGFVLYKSAFQVALALRCNWLPDRMPTRYACNEPFTVEHALSCLKGAFPIHCHNEIRAITYSILSEVSHDVSFEPTLQLLDGHTLTFVTHLGHSTVDFLGAWEVWWRFNNGCVRRLRTTLLNSLYIRI